MGDKTVCICVCVSSTLNDCVAVAATYIKKRNQETTPIECVISNYNNNRIWLFLSVIRMWSWNVFSFSLCDWLSIFAVAIYFNCKVSTDQTWWWLVFKSFFLSALVFVSVSSTPPHIHYIQTYYTHIGILVYIYIRLCVPFGVYLLTANIIKLMNDMEKTPLLYTEYISMCAIYFAIFRWLNVGVNNGNELRWMEMYKQNTRIRTHIYAHTHTRALSKSSLSLSRWFAFPPSVEHFVRFFSSEKRPTK